MQYTVGLGAKRSTHTVDLVNMGGGDHTFSAKSQTHRVGYAVGMQYTVDIGAKRSNSHSGLSKYGWWGPLPLVQKGQTPCSGCAVNVCYKYIGSLQFLFIWCLDFIVVASSR